MLKLLEHLVAARNSGYSATVLSEGGLRMCLSFMCSKTRPVFKDCIDSAMKVINRCCEHVVKGDENLLSYVAQLSELLTHSDANIAHHALLSFAILADRCIKQNVDPTVLVTADLLATLLQILVVAPTDVTAAHLNTAAAATAASAAAAATTAVTAAELLTLLSCTSISITHTLLLTHPLVTSITSGLCGAEKLARELGRFIAGLIDMTFLGKSLYKPLRKTLVDESRHGGESEWGQIIHAIRSKNITEFVELFEARYFSNPCLPRTPTLFSFSVLKMLSVVVLILTCSMTVAKAC